VVHDNQCLGNGILGMIDDGWPLLTTLHHPITVDRQLALSHATNPWQQFTQRRWFGFLRMQVKVARALPRVVTVSESSKRTSPPDGRRHRADDRRAGRRGPHRVPAPGRRQAPVPGRIMVTSSSDVPMKGLVPLLEAVAKLRTERDIELVVIGNPRPDGRVAKAIERLGLADDRAVRQRHQRRCELARNYARPRWPWCRRSTRGSRCRPSRRWPAAWPWWPPPAGPCPKWWATDGETGLLVAPDDPGALAGGHRTRCSTTAALRRRLGAAGRERVLGRFTWQVTAAGTAACSTGPLLDGKARSAPAGRG
jgi:glycosyltransferase involved in cell wall biosynthesis